MLQAMRQNPGRSTVSQLKTTLPPVGGLNSVDPLADMPATDAIVMDNFFPKINTVELRKGFTSWATGLVGQVQTLMSYYSLAGATDKLFAAANNHIYDATTSGSVTSAYATSITSSKWQWTTFSNTAGYYILAVNGADYPLKYDGSSWSQNKFGGSITSSGKSVINIFQFKERIFLVQKNSLTLWYLATQAISGTPAPLPLGGVFNKGGQILAGGTFSFDAGSSIDDYLVAVTDNGEAAVYTGITPGSDFALRGVFDVGMPVGNRCLFKVGGDLIIITSKGAIPLSALIQNDRAKADKLAITAKIAPTFNKAVQDWSANFGWQGFVYPKGGYVLVNVPENEGAVQRQYVQNVLTGAWCRFTGQNANCWGILNDNLYFGGNAIVYKADTLFQDNGSQISFELKTAFEYCGSPGQNKMFSAVKPYFITGGAISIAVGVDVDFGNSNPTSIAASSPGTVCTWGVGKWGQSVWGGLGLQIRNWLTAGQIGTCASVHVKGAANAVAVQYNGADLLYQRAKGSVY